jgi:hypothetical protein
MFSPFIVLAPLLDRWHWPPLVLQVDLVLQGHVHCAERVHPQYNGTVVALPTNEGAGPASQVCTVRGSDQAMAASTINTAFVYHEFIWLKNRMRFSFHYQLWV